MVLSIRHDGDVTILGNFGRFMNDPRYVDAAREVDELLDQGERCFIMEMSGVNETGGSFLGVLMTMTREIRKAGGEVVMARVGGHVSGYLAEMYLDEHWDIFPTVDAARRFFQRHEPE